MSLANLRSSTILYVALAAFATAPIWVVKYPPLEDIPFHLAAIRVIHDYNNPAFGFTRDFVLSVGRTQYLLYYLAASFLAYFVGVAKANALMMSAYLAGTPLALRDLLRALGRDERLCLFSIPLLANVMFLFGLLPFLLGIPLMLLASAQLVRHIREPRWSTGIAISLLGILTFYAHVFPFAVFGFAYIALFPWESPRRWIRAGAPALPIFVPMTHWLWFSIAGQKSSTGLATMFEGHPLDHSLPDVFSWLTNIFHDQSDERILVGWGLLAVVGAGLSLGHDDNAAPLARRWFVVPLLCILGYLTTGDTMGPLFWLLCQRFPILAMFTIIPLLRIPRGIAGMVTTGAIALLGIHATVNTTRHFQLFQRTEVGDFDRAIAVMAPAKRVAALIYDAGSRVVRLSPFLHFGSYYQLEKGGMVQFNNADLEHWPFRYRAGHHPPPSDRTPPRWEWMPDRVSVHDELVPYFDYVLTRGHGFHPPAGTFRRAWQGGVWSVWENEHPPSLQEQAIP